MKRICSIDGCELQHRSRGWCSKHYNRWLKHGDPLTTLMPRGDNLEDRFWPKVERAGGAPSNLPELGDCWLWLAGKYASGYGKFRLGKRTLTAHRVSYEDSYGEIPEGLVVDHICHNKSCVNPKHLQAVSNKENGENRQGLPISNSSGYLGVSWHKTREVWAPTVASDGVLYNLKYSPLYELHVAGYRAMKKRNELFTNNLHDVR